MCHDSSYLPHNSLQIQFLLDPLSFTENNHLNSTRLADHALQTCKISREWKPFKRLWNVNGDSLETSYSGIRIKKKKDKGKDKKEQLNTMQRVYVRIP
jgi:hypothetical protein